MSVWMSVLLTGILSFGTPVDTAAAGNSSVADASSSPTKPVAGKLRIVPPFFGCDFINGHDAISIPSFIGIGGAGTLEIYERALVEVGGGFAEYIGLEDWDVYARLGALFELADFRNGERGSLVQASAMAGYRRLSIQRDADGYVEGETSHHVTVHGGLEYTYYYFRRFGLNLRFLVSAGYAAAQEDTPGWNSDCCLHYPHEDTKWTIGLGLSLGVAF